MLTTEEKLQHFSQLVFSQAQKQSNEMIDQARQDAKEKVELYENQCLERAYKEIQKQLVTIQRQANESVSKLQIQVKKDLLIQREALMKEIFDEVIAKIMHFKETDEYDAFLEQTIRQADDFFGKGPKTVFIDHSDEKRLPSLKKKFRDLDFVVLDETDDIIGGARILQPQTNQIADNTIAARLSEQKQNFLTTSGLVL